MMNKIHVITLFLLTLICITSCTDPAGVTSNAKSIQIPNPDYVDPNEFLSNNFHSNKIGNITVQYDYTDYYANSTDSVYGAWSKYFAIYSVFHREGDNTSKIPCNGIYINNYILNTSQLGTLLYSLASMNSEKFPGQQLFATHQSNNINILESPLIPGLDTNFIFDAPLQLITPTRNSQISKQNDLAIRWDSLHTYLVQIYLQTISPGSSQASITASTYLTNTSQFIIPASVLQKFPKGVINLMVAETKVYYLNFNNGTEIPLFYQTSHSVDILLTD